MEDDILPPPTVKLIATFASHTSTVRCVRFHPQGSLIASCSHDKELRVWDTRVPIATSEPSFHAAEVSCIAGSACHGTVPYAVSAALDDTVKVWNYKTSACCFTSFPRHAARVTALCMPLDASYYGKP